MPRLKRVPDDALRFGLIIRRLRRQRRLTLTMLSYRLGMSASHLGVLEKGRNVPTIITLLNIAQALGVDPAEIVRELVAGREAERPIR